MVTAEFHNLDLAREGLKYLQFVFANRVKTYIDGEWATRSGDILFAKRTPVRRLGNKGNKYIAVVVNGERMMIRPDRDATVILKIEDDSE